MSSEHLIPLGNRVLILPDSIEEVSKGGIIIGGGAEFERQEKAACTTGTIVDFGPSAWLDPALGGEPWVKKGDRVVFAKYSGKYIKDPEDDKIEYMVVNDDAIQVRIEE